MKKKKIDFISCCKKFYYEKTNMRIDAFKKKYPYIEKIKTINDIKILPINNLLKKINWKNICQGKIGRFHGDFHFENIIWNQIEEKFIFLDWRQDFWR